MNKHLKVLMIFTLLFILVGANTGRVVAETPVISISPDLPNAEYTKQYNQQLTAEGGAEPYTFSLLSGTLPGGLSLSPSGLISGFPQGEGAKPGSYPITIQVVDADSETVTRDYDFVVDKGTPTMTTSAVNPSYWNTQLILWAYVRMFYEGTVGPFNYLGGTVAFSVDENPVPGCQVVPLVDDYFSCKVAASQGLSVGSHIVKAVFTPTEGDKYYPAEESSDFTVLPTHFMIMGAVFGDQNQNGIKDVGEYGLGSGWPVYLDQNCDGSIDVTTSTGNTGGYYQFLNITAGYWYCVSAEARPGYQLTSGLSKVWLIDNVVSMHIGFYYPTIILSPNTIPAVQLGDAIYQQFTASGGAEPYSYRITSGTLPAGLSFTVAGLLSGTPTTTGSAWIKIEAEDSNHAVGEKYYQILVKTDGLFTFTSSSNPSMFGDPVTFTVSASGEANDPNYGQIPPYGAVSFYVDGYENEDCSYLPLNQSVDGIGDYPVTCVMSLFEPGVHQITARFFSSSEVYNTPTLELTQTVVAGKSSDLYLLSEVSKTQVKPGAKLVYNFKISNLGPDAANDLLLIDTLDYNTTFTSINAPKGWTCGHTDGVVTCTSSKLTAGKTATVIVTVIVNKTAPIGQELFNYANVTNTNYDPDLTNNYAYQQSVVRK